jgi:hypothetical protein
MDFFVVDPAPHDAWLAALPQIKSPFTARVYRGFFDAAWLEFPCFPYR